MLYQVCVRRLPPGLEVAISISRAAAALCGSRCLPGPHACRSTWPLLLTEGGTQPICGDSCPERRGSRSARGRASLPWGPSSGCGPRSHSRHARGQLGKELGAGNGCPSQENAVRAVGRRDPGFRAEGEGGLCPLPQAVTQAPPLCLCFFVCKVGASPPPVSDRSLYGTGGLQPCRREVEAAVGHWVLSSLLRFRAGSCS